MDPDLVHWPQLRRQLCRPLIRLRVKAIKLHLQPSASRSGLAISSVIKYFPVGELVSLKLLVY